VASIVGPPGCGKSFAGAELALAILAATNQKLLVVCFTNHALDQFLCHLLDRNERRIVRIGGKSREERLERFSLFNLKRQAHGGKDKAEKRRIWALHTELDASRDRMHDLCAAFLAATDLTWSQVVECLEFEDDDALEQLMVPRNEHGFEIADRSGKSIKEDYLWKRWQAGYGPEPFHNRADAPLWRLSAAQRQAKLAEWVEKSIEETRVDLVAERHRFDRLDAELSAMDTASERAVLQATRVIAATTTGSAKYRAIIESAAPGVLLLEEVVCLIVYRQCHARERTNDPPQPRRPVANPAAATIAHRRQTRHRDHRTIARCRRPLPLPVLNVRCNHHSFPSPAPFSYTQAGEVLEAHVISSLSAKVAHVIMIGDHKQLRPKVETHALTVAAKNGHNLNCSLFERLIIGGLPHETLLTQHRMRPEISSIARHMTYPELRDHESVLGRPNMRGLAANVCFINHNVFEQGEVSDGLGSRSLSKVNVFEADMAVQVVQFLLLQGYRSDSIVVLTPYLGQLKILNGKFQRHRIVATVGERDVDDLLNIGVEQPWLLQTSQTAKGIRTCTIDNYQGEEADVIITTLVRSNPQGQLGFLGKADAEQRVNVLCTRARLGMIFIGNAQCFLKASPRSQLWTRLLGFLQQRGEIFEGLPIKCQQHAVVCQPAKVNTPELLRQWCANGAGCGRQCDSLLSCGHVCPLKCHPWEHESIQCEQPVREICPAGLHRVERACSSEAMPFCNHKVIEQCQQEHPLVRLCGDAKTPSCSVCNALNDAAKAHGDDSARRAQEVAELLQRRVEQAAKLDGEAGTTEGMRGAVRAELEKLTQAHAARQLDGERKLAKRLDRATREAQQAVRVAMLELEEMKRRDEARLHARRAEHERLLQVAAERMEQQRVEQQQVADTDIRERDDQMRTLHEALAANLEADEAAIAQANADRANPAEVERQLDQVRRSAKPVSCAVCMDDLTILDGPLCRPVNGHFLCRGCFDNHVTAEASKPGFDGHVYCPYRPAAAGGCASAPYPGAVIARHATPVAFDAVTRSRAALREREISENMQREFDARLDAEKVRYKMIAAEEIRLQDAKKHIVDKILTLSCPRCSQAFIEFEGCFALTCSRQGCGCGFCAYCLKDCDADAHQHVAICPQNTTRDVFGSKEVFEQAQKARRERVVHEYLQESNFSTGTRQRLIKMCMNEFTDIGLKIK
jgi:hypothetical protein